MLRRWRRGGKRRFQLIIPPCKKRDGEAMRRGLGALLWCQGHRAGAGFQGTPLTLREASCAPRKQTVRDRMGTAHPQGDLCQVAPRMVVGESSSWYSIGHVRCEPLWHTLRYQPSRVGFSCGSLPCARRSSHPQTGEQWDISWCFMTTAQMNLRVGSPGNPMSSRAE